MTTNIKNLNAIRTMNKKQIFSIASIVVIGLLATNQVNAISEDQSYVCKHERHITTDPNNDSMILVCTDMQDSELFTDKTSAELYQKLNDKDGTFEVLKTTTINEEIE